MLAKSQSKINQRTPQKEENWQDFVHLRLEFGTLLDFDNELNFKCWKSKNNDFCFYNKQILTSKDPDTSVEKLINHILNDHYNIHACDKDNDNN